MISAPTRRLPVADGARPVALTFDDGPWAPITARAVHLLAARGVPATFFMVGNQVEKDPDLARRVIDSGMAVGVHGWDHVALDGQRRAAVHAQLSRCMDALRGVGGEPRCFRPPYGAYDAETLGVADDLGLRTVMWSVDAEDWKIDDPAEIAMRVIEEVHPGAIVLFHDRKKDSTAILDALVLVLDALDEGGYTVVDLFTALTGQS